MIRYNIPKFNKEFPCFCVVNEVFNAEEVSRICDLEDLQKFSQAVVGNQNAGRVDEKTRESEVMWVTPDEHSDWLFQKFAHLTSHVNYDFFLYDIEFLESFQYTVYKKGFHYTWHIDPFNTYNTYERKISASVMLSDPEDYDGGEFQIVTNGNIEEPITVKPKKGDVIFFASWMPHRVVPVKSGIRKSLVAWVQGKRSI